MPQVLDAPESLSESQSPVAIDVLEPPALFSKTSPAKARKMGTLLRGIVSVCTASGRRYGSQPSCPLQTSEMFLDHLIRTDPYFYINATSA